MTKKTNDNGVDLSWKRYLLPDIHPEGLKILGVMFVIFLVFGLFYPWTWVLGLPMLVFTFYFFRNPVRVTPQGEDLIISPADGIVSNIKQVVPPKELDIGTEPLTRISIFMSVFSVHVNRAPVTGTVHALHYRPGKFVSVADKDSEDNERQEICLRMSNGTRIGFIQIAGLVARRIYCPLQIGHKLKAGQIFGMIRFGSRLDVFLPKGVEPSVLLGQTSVAGETVLADMSHKVKKK
ncbi:MAG: phosphatidylserine decarboxylase [Alphaproteobacteria bacterium]